MSFEQYVKRVMSGAERGAAAAALRAALAAAEPLYAAAVTRRNRRYDRDPSRGRRLPRPAVSVGNVTTGGTGKTPVVRWLASRLRDAGRRVAVLSRGYKAAAAGSLGDEQVMLDGLLNAAGRPPVVIRADPDRFAAGQAALRDHPDLDVFVLDDGFQHRRVARDLDVVLVNAAEPFGFGRVLPRGLLREPLDGLRRAGAVVLTHALAVGEAERSRVVDVVRRHNRAVPLYRCVHAAAGVRTSAGPDLQPTDVLRRARVFALCGIGNPTSFERELRALAGTPDGYAGHRWFPDHHAFTRADLDAVRRAARAAGAGAIVTTEKDWVKLAHLPGVGDADPPVWRLDVAAQFLESDGDRLMAQVLAVIDAAASTRA